VLALRAQILERNQALKNAGSAATSATPAAGSGSGGFGATLEAALKSVNQQQDTARAASDAYERGDSVDVAKVMLARQQASISFEATLQVRNKLLSAYKDIMSMPV
jgi:flagellar hook-basal body complex protein FliE